MSGTGTQFSSESGELLTRLLKRVSRSFYLTLRILPGAVRRPIGLAYLLARATDTVADTEVIPVSKRLAALESLRARILGDRGRDLDLGEFAPQQGTEAERELLLRVESALAGLCELEAVDSGDIRAVLEVITSGQILDLRRFGQAGEARIVALQNETDLDDYTWRVAGCVGQFWTRVCRRHLFPEAPIDEALLLGESVRFGKGLQLINILRDLPGDLRLGRCYVPKESLGEVGLVASDLLEPAVEPRFRPVYDRYLELARGHLGSGWAYTNRLPWDQRRVRLACAWPILMGVATLNGLKREPILMPSKRVKITRQQVYGIVVRSCLRLWSRKAWDRQFSEAFSEVWGGVNTPD